VLADQGTDGAAVYMNGCDMESGEIKQTCGVFAIRRKDFLRLGGFMPWLCAADTEFMVRLGVAGILKICEQKILMGRRRHKGQITQDPNIGARSTLRQGYIKQIKYLRQSGIVKVGMVTTNCERIR